MSKKKILIVEDDTSIRKALSYKLKDSGIEFLAAPNGLEGLETAVSEKPNLILLDLLMPTQDGLTMLRNLRQDEWGKNADVVILTNLSSEEHFKEAKKLGVTDHFIKAESRLDDVAEFIIKRIVD